MFVRFSGANDCVPSYLERSPANCFCSAGLAQHIAALRKLRVLLPFPGTHTTIAVLPPQSRIRGGDLGGSKRCPGGALGQFCGCRSVETVYVLVVCGPRGGAEQTQQKTQLRVRSRGFIMASVVFGLGHGGLGSFGRGWVVGDAVCAGSKPAHPVTRSREETPNRSHVFWSASVMHANIFLLVWIYPGWCF